MAAYEELNNSYIRIVLPNLIHWDWEDIYGDIYGLLFEQIKIACAWYSLKNTLSLFPFLFVAIIILNTIANILNS